MAALQVKKLVSPLLFAALIIISIIVVRMLGENETSSMLTIDNDEPQPPITQDGEIDEGGGVGTVGQDEEGEGSSSGNSNGTSYNDLMTVSPSFLPSMISTANNTDNDDATNTPSVIMPSIEQTNGSPTALPSGSLFSGSPSLLLSNQPSATKLVTPFPSQSPSPLPTTTEPTPLPTTAEPTPLPTVKPATAEPTASPTNEPTSLPTNQPTPLPTTAEPTPLPTNQPTQPLSKSPIYSTPTLSPSSTIYQLLTTMPSVSASLNSTRIESDTDQIINQNQQDSATTYHATKGCVQQQSSSSTTTCIPSQHTTSLAVNCCSGSQSTNNLKCKRPNCIQTKSYFSAKSHCERKGMRLCTHEELNSGSCCNKGCGFNNKLSWAADTCAPTISPTSIPTVEPSWSPSRLPTISPTNGPSGMPSVSPTGVPTTSPTKREGTLVNFSDGGGDRSVGDNEEEETSTIGIIFEVEALRNLAITSLATMTNADYKTWSEVWIREGRYQGKTADDTGWKRVYFKYNQQYGTNAPLTMELDNPTVFIPEGQIMSFYLVSPGKFLSDQGTVEGDVIAEDNSLRLYTGAAIDHGRWEDGCTDDVECILPARVFNGAISYATATMPPTHQPTPDPFEVQPSGLTVREEQWLDGHNIRREKWHKMYGKKYKPLKWSEGLKDMAQAYADELAAVCGPTVHESYEKRKGYGENLASNTGRDEGGGSWGELKPVDKVMTRFVEREATWEPPANGHFTQVLWYATTHVGCADSVGVKPSGAVCRYQVCRYARTGNCGVKSFNDGSKEWWMKAVMQDSSRCRPFCPPEGCDVR